MRKTITAGIISAMLLMNTALAETPTPVPSIAPEGGTMETSGEMSGFPEITGMPELPSGGITGIQTPGTEETTPTPAENTTPGSAFTIPDSTIPSSLTPSAWVPGEGLNINNITPENLAVTYQDMLFDVQGQSDKSFSEKISSVFSIDMVTDNIREIGSTDLLSQANLDMGMLNLQFEGLSTGLKLDYETGVELNKAGNCMELFDKTYGGMVNKDLEVLEIPDDFDPAAMMKKANENIFNTYSDALNSGDFKAVRSSINTSDIFAAAARGAQSYGLMSTSTLSGMMTGFGKAQMNNEYAVNAQNADNAIANIDIYKRSSQALLNNTQYGSSILYKLENGGSLTQDDLKSVYGTLKGLEGIVSWDPNSLLKVPKETLTSEDNYNMYVMHGTKAYRAIEEWEKEHPNATDEEKEKAKQDILRQYGGTFKEEKEIADFAKDGPINDGGKAWQSTDEFANAKTIADVEEQAKKTLTPTPVPATPTPTPTPKPVYPEPDYETVKQYEDDNKVTELPDGGKKYNYHFKSDVVIKNIPDIKSSATYVLDYVWYGIQNPDGSIGNMVTVSKTLTRKDSTTKEDYAVSSAYFDCYKYDFVAGEWIGETHGGGPHHGTFSTS